MKIVRSALLLLLFLGGITLWTLMHSRSVEHAFVRVQLGDEEAAVARAMGKPAHLQPCEPRLQQSPRCATEMLYKHPFAPVVPEFWILSLDEDHRVVAKIHSTQQ